MSSASAAVPACSACDELGTNAKPIVSHNGARKRTYGITIGAGHHVRECYSQSELRKEHGHTVTDRRRERGFANAAGGRLAVWALRDERRCSGYQHADFSNTLTRNSSGR